MRRTLLVAWVAVAAVAFVTLSVTAAAPAGGPPRYLDQKASIHDRVNDLLHRMTIQEKVGQMDQQLVGNLTGPSNACGSQGFAMPNATCMKTVLVDNYTGSVLAGGTDNPPDTTGAGGAGNTGFDWANEYNMIQKYAIENSRLHIPLIFGVDAVHGFGHPWQAPLYPQSIGMGATWDPSAARAGGVATADALRATGWVWDFAPVQDLARDNRWGRTYETWAEEPALSAAMGAANVQGLQAPGPAHSLDVTATVKHFAGYSQAINGHDRNEALLPLSYLQSVILPSYAGGIDAGAGTVMVDSGSINGVPATGSRYLLTDILRHQMHFRGVVISDYQDVQALQGAYHVVPDLAAAIAKAVNAGVDMAMFVSNSDQWQAAILHDVESGAISKARINEAVGRILTLKFKLGLFDQPCVEDPSTPCVDANAADAAVTAGRDATLRAAQESMTLLRNQNGALPLSPSGKVVVTGPSADSMTNQLGGWSVSWQGVFGAGHVCCMGPPDQIPPGTTVKAGVSAADPNVTFAPDQASAVAAAAGADAIVVAVGEKAYAEGLGDNPAPALPADQKALVAALQATGKPVIVVVIAGRPLGLGPAGNAAGLLMAYQRSTEAGTAVADVIFGKVNPSARLPVSWPSEADTPGGDFCGTCPSPLGDQPKFFDQLPDTGSGQGHNYNPRYPFGFGLSYTTFQTSGLAVDNPTVSRNGTVHVTLTVANTGSRAGTDVVPVYVHQPVSDVVVPPQRLVAFTRVTLAPGQSTVVHLSFPVSVLAVTAGDVDSTARPQVESGGYQVQVDTASAAFTVR